MLLFSIGRQRPRYEGQLSIFLFPAQIADLRQWFGNVILRLSQGYVQNRPAALPGSVSWPEKEDIVDSLASIADLRWP